MADYSALFEAAGKQYNVDPKLLASVMQPESSGDPNAVSPKGATGLMQLEPPTAKEMGVTNITDPQQNIFGGAKYLSQQLDKYGNLPTALAAYNAGPGAVDSHGGIPPFPETQAYVQKVLTRYQGGPQQAFPGQPAAVPQSIPGLPPTADAPGAASGSDPFSALMAKAGPAPAQDAAPAAPAQVADPFSALMAKAAAAPAAAAVAQAAPKAAPAAPATPATPSAPLKASDYAGAAVEPLLTGITSAIAQPIGGAARLASAILGNNYAGAKQAGDNVSNALTYHPQTQGGQQALAGIENAANSAGNAIMASPVGNPLRDIAQGYNKTFVQGAPNALMATINSQVPSVIANAVAGPVIGKGAELAGSAVNKLADIAASRAPVNALAARVEPSLAPETPPAPSPAPVPAPVPVEPAAKPNFIPNGDGTFTPAPRLIVPEQPQPVTQAANSSSFGPRAAAPTLQDAANASNFGPRPADPAGTANAPPASPQSASVTQLPVFTEPDLPTPKTVLAPAAQTQNIETMHAIGLDTQRPSAIAGDKFMAGGEYQQSKLDTPQGEAMRAQLGAEQNAIKNYALNLIQRTGSTEIAPEAVGQAIRAPLQALSEHYDTGIRQLYQTADQRAGGEATVQPTSLSTLLNTNSTFAGKAENTALRRGVNAYLREQDIVGPDGALQPMTVRTAEGVRQYLNSQWSPQNSGLIGRVKEALDTDVTQAGGSDIYAQARALHAERKNTLDNPNGISSLLNENGPNGINQAVPDERVAQKVLTMPTGQLSHIVDTLRALPSELAGQGQQAIAEMKGALADRVYRAGDKGGTQNGPSVWNAANVTRELNAQASRMAMLFSPEEINGFHTLNDAGHILQTPSAYPGAAVQGHNLVQKGLIYAPAAIGAAVGNHIGGLPGATAGSWAGNALSKKLATAADQRAANKLQQMLSNPKVIGGK